MRRVEKESFLKSFLLFLSSLTLLMATLFYNLYTREQINLDNRIFSQMRLCSFDLKCKDLEIDFADAKKSELYVLKKDDKALFAYFPIPGSSQYVLQISYLSEKYREDLAKIQKELLFEFFAIFIVLILLSVLFSFYALHPLREALKLTEEFIRDILHDFNTPLSIVRLNVRMLKKDCPQSTKIDRIEQAVETLLRLQNNLRSYIGGHELQKEVFSLDELLKERVQLIERAFSHLKFDLQISPLKIVANKDAMIRIIDNILSNAAKYNKKDGSITVKLIPDLDKLIIEDTGIGIEYPHKVFERFYKENDRGIGIGLHIVKKLCDEMNIDIELKSKKDEGTTVTLFLDKVTFS
ncbi:sensor histidine kinase [Hydrogenimonas thermophila]|nr:ATP-binding protein [Hydrogenimonas thermophila]